MEDLLDHAEEIGRRHRVTDHNVFGGALEAVELARDRDLVVIPGEEVKTESQGEVIGLFWRTRSRAACRSPTRSTQSANRAASSISPIRSIGFTPSPIRRPIHRHLAEIDVFEVYNARLLRDSFNDEALRFARKYRLLQGAGSDAHVLQGVGTGVVRMRRFDGPEEFLPVTPLRGDPAPPEVARVPAVAQVGAQVKESGPLREKGARLRARLPTDEIYERYLKKAISEINELGDELARAGDELRCPSSDRDTPSPTSCC